MNASVDSRSGRSNVIVRAARKIGRILYRMLAWALKDSRSGSIYM
jgi:hypothetical protein